jgi:transcriptional regulator with XRE-family HTH domain
MERVERREIAEPKRMDRGPFGTRLKQLREEHRVSQSKLAERAGFDHSYVSRLESGARTPTREAVTQLGAALKLDGSAQDSLLAAAGFLPKEVSSLLSAEPEISEVLHLLHNEAVPTEVRDILRAQLRLLAEQVRFTVPTRTTAHVAA